MNILFELYYINENNDIIGPIKITSNDNKNSFKLIKEKLKESFEFFNKTNEIIKFEYNDIPIRGCGKLTLEKGIIPDIMMGVEFKQFNFIGRTIKLNILKYNVNDNNNNNNINKNNNKVYNKYTTNKNINNSKKQKTRRKSNRVENNFFNKNINDINTELELEWDNINTLQNESDIIYTKVEELYNSKYKVEGFDYRFSYDFL